MGMEEVQLDNKWPAASMPVCNASSPEGTAYVTTRSLARRRGWLFRRMQRSPRGRILLRADGAELSERARAMVGTWATYSRLED